MAQAGVLDASQLDAALASVTPWLHEKLSLIAQKLSLWFSFFLILAEFLVPFAGELD